MDDERSTTVHDRYEIGCSVCGHLGNRQSWYEAMNAANDVSHYHSEAGEHIEVFDRMAHIGQPNRWDINGKALGRR